MLKQSIVVLTGAGISAESGLKTFRDHDGLWENHRVEDVATCEAFERDPQLVHRFYNARRANLAQVEPNAAHRALVALEQGCENLLLVTQNVDDLHQRAGSQSVLPMHGSLLQKRCLHCQTVSTQREDIAVDSVCQDCGQAGGLRPHIVWFGEMPIGMDEIHAALCTCDVFISIGTSGSVYPAAGLVQVARAAGAHTVELNLVPSDVQNDFAEHHYGPASEVVPAYVASLLHEAE